MQREFIKGPEDVRSHLQCSFEFQVLGCPMTTEFSTYPSLIGSAETLPGSLAGHSQCVAYFSPTKSLSP